MTGRAALGAILLLLAGSADPAASHSYRLGDIRIGHVWAPPPAKGAAGMPVYGPILNEGKAPAWLVGVSSPVAEKARFRILKNGVARWPATIALRPGKPVGLAAWRVHVWLSGLKRPIRDGDAFDLALDFGKAGTITVKVIAEKTPGD